MTLTDELKQALADSLKRQASTKCSTWAKNYVILGKPVPGPYDTRRHPWQKEWIDCEESWVGKKAAQMGMTLAALLRSIFVIDIKKIDVLYLLPKRSPDASDFSKTKFDPLLEMSPHLNKLFSATRNVGLKQAGSTSFYLRGARSKSGLKTISTGLMVYDEYDEHPKGSSKLAQFRQFGFEEGDRQDIKISTPTIDDFGIDAEFKLTSQESYFFKCPGCGKFIDLTLDNLKITADDVRDPKLKDSYLACKCGKILPHEEKPKLFESAIWVPAKPKVSYRGFHINQLYSTVTAPWRIAQLVLEAQTDPAAEQELYNSALGLARIVAGGKIDENMILACIGSHIKATSSSGQLVTMGVDVGKRLHVEIDQWMLPPNFGKNLNTFAIPKVLYEGTVADFEELDNFMSDFQVSHAVIDANPETRKAQEFAERFEGHVNLCYFNRTLKSRQDITFKDHFVSVHRTSWLDLSQDRFKRGRKGIILPSNTSNEYKNHIRALVRKPELDADGNPTARYISTGADHFAFARLYSEIALPLAISIAENRDVTDLL